MVERCRNMDAVEYSMFLHRPIPISWSILRQSPNFLVMSESTIEHFVTPVTRVSSSQGQHTGDTEAGGGTAAAYRSRAAW